MRLFKRAVGLSLAAASFTAAPALFAQERGLGLDNPLVVSLEHLGGVSKVSIEPDGGNDIDVTYVGTFMGFIASYGPLSRLGIHYFAAPPLSIGAILHYSDNDDLGTNAMAGVRIGAGIPIDSGFGLWIRGGIAYVSQEIDLVSETTFTDIRPGGEVLLVLQPVEHFGFLVGGMFEKGIAGKMEREDGRERDFDYMEYGLTLGVMGDF
jgi:hypothetical protein